MIVKDTDLLSKLKEYFEPESFYSDSEYRSAFCPIPEEFLSDEDKKIRRLAITETHQHNARRSAEQLLCKGKWKKLSRPLIYTKEQWAHFEMLYKLGKFNEIINYADQIWRSVTYSDIKFLERINTQKQPDIRPIDLDQEEL